MQVRNIIILVAFAYSVTGQAVVCANPGVYETKLKAPPKDWDRDTVDFLEAQYVRCFNAVNSKPKNCGEQELERLSELMDTTSPNGMGPGYPLGTKPDTSKKGHTDLENESLKHERKAAQKLARNGYDVRYATDENLYDPKTRWMVEEAKREHHLPKHANFDLLVNGKPFDVYSPLGKTGVDGIRATLQEKSVKQTGRIVLYSEPGGNLSKTEFRAKLRDSLRTSPPDKLHEVLVVKDDGTISRLFP